MPNSRIGAEFPDRVGAVSAAPQQRAVIGTSRATIKGNWCAAQEFRLPEFVPDAMPRARDHMRASAYNTFTFYGF
jgi:hypothetical protein